MSEKWPPGRSDHSKRDLFNRFNMKVKYFSAPTKYRALPLISLWNRKYSANQDSSEPPLMINLVSGKERAGSVLESQNNQLVNSLNQSPRDYSDPEKTQTPRFTRITKSPDLPDTPDSPELPDSPPSPEKTFPYVKMKTSDVWTR